MVLIMFILISYGLTNAITNEYVFEWLRNSVKNISVLNKLITCPVCTGFYIGMILSLFFPIFHTNCIINLLFGGLISSAINKILKLIEFKF